MLKAIKDIPFLAYLVLAVRDKNSIRQILLECISDIRLVIPEVVNRQYQLSRVKGTTWALYSTFKHAKEALKLRDQFTLIRKPTLFIWGERDLIFPPRLGENLHRTIAGSKLLKIEGSGHIPMWETPDEVNRAILDFLQE
jgi:pimeloyl-[acyl-carrier protein] methyl ester esterase